MPWQIITLYLEVLHASNTSHLLTLHAFKYNLNMLCYLIMFVKGGDSMNNSKTKWQDACSTALKKICMTCRKICLTWLDTIFPIYSHYTHYKSLQITSICCRGCSLYSRVIFRAEIERLTRFIAREMHLLLFRFFCFS